MASGATVRRADPPRAPDALVVRTRLLELLDRAMTVPLTLVVGGPGTGKSTLVATWARASADSVTWIGMTEQDQRPATFWQHVRRALGGDAAGDRPVADLL